MIAPSCVSRGDITAGSASLQARREPHERPDVKLPTRRSGSAQQGGLDQAERANYEQPSKTPKVQSSNRKALPDLSERAFDLRLRAIGGGGSVQSQDIVNGCRAS